MTPRFPSSKNVSEWFNEDIQPFVDRLIKQSMEDCRHYRRLIHHTKSGRKPYHPGLVILIGELCELNEQQLQDCALGVKLLHTFSLIHDDLVDGDETHRDCQSFQTVHGSNQAKIISDMFLSQALKSIPNASTALTIDAIQKMTVGQRLDIILSGRRGITEEQYFEMIEKKTGALFNLCLSLPQDLTDKDLDIDDYRSLWLAFQIRDDLLDFENGEKCDTIGDNVREGKRTLMAIHADDEITYNILDKPYRDTTNEDVATVKRIFTETGSFEYARNRMHTCAENALLSLESLPDCPQRQYLIDIAHFCTDRNH